MKRLLLLSFLLWQFTAVAQENIHLHLDKSFYVLGETIWFSAQLQAATPTAKKANILRIDLIDSDGIARQTEQFSIENGRVQGSIDISLDWSDGWYTFHAYTVWIPQPTIKNSTRIDIPIYNDFKEYTFLANETQTPSNNADNITISTNKKNYKRGEEISLDISTINSFKAAWVSVTVVPSETVSQSEQISQVFSTTNAQMPEEKPFFYGHLINPQSHPLGVGGHFTKDNQLQWTTANDDGVFMLENRLEVEQASQLFGLFNNQNEIYITPIAVQPIDFLKTIKSYKKEKVLPFNTIIKEYLRKSRLRKKYGALFNNPKSLLIKKEEKENNYFRPDATYRVADYANMTSLEEFLREVIPFIKIKNRGGAPNIRMFNEEKVFTTENPFYLIDNWLTDDQTLALNIPINDIEVVDLFRETQTLKEQFGVLGKYGIIAIRTKQKKYSPDLQKQSNVVKTSGVSTPKSFTTSNFSYDKLPDFRSTIFWNPALQLTAKESHFSFYHSDDLGDFSIIINGLAEDGDIVKGRVSYQVK